MATPATPPEEQAARSNQAALVALVVLGVAALAAVVYFLFLRGDGDEITTTPAPEATPAPTPLPSPVQTPDRPDRGRVENFELFAARDPFEPLVTDEEAAGQADGAQQDGPAEDGAAEDGAAPDGEAPADGTGEPAPDGTGARPPGEGRRAETGAARQVEGRRVRLVDVFTENGRRRAQVEVDGTVFTVRPGETFADNFQLLSISGRCATFLFGDDQFTLCEGQEILK